MKKVFFIFSIVLCTFAAQAQRNGEIEIIDIDPVTGDSVYHAPSSVVVLYDTRPIFPRRNPAMPVGNPPTDLFLRMERQFQDPRAPRFILINRKGTAALGIGGYVKGSISVDFRGMADSKDFITYTIPTPNNPAQNGQFQMDASTSRLFLSLVGNNRIMGNYTVYLESNFRGGNGNYTLQLRQAFIDMRSVKAGLAWSTFTDVAACPPTIDFQGPCGLVSARNVMLQYHPSLGKHWSMAVAVEAPSATMTTRSQQSEYITQRMPDIPLYLQYGWDETNSHVRVSGILRGLSYRNLLAEKNKMKLGWGVQLSGVANISHWLTIYGDAVYGNGIEEYINDLGGYGFDLVPAASAGSLTAPAVWGATGGVQVNISPRMFASASYSQCRMYDGELNAQTYRYAQYVVGNLFYNITKDCQIGIEYLYGRRVDRDDTSGHANRLNAAIQYNF